MTKKKIAIVLFDETEPLDFAGPYEVFATATGDDGSLLCEVELAAEKEIVACRGGMRVISDKRLHEVGEVDLIVVPGGPGARAAAPGNDKLIAWLKSRRKTVIASVCTGTFLLGRAGLLGGKRVTTHQHYFDDLASEYSDSIVDKTKVVDEGSVITSGGISSGIDMSLYLLEKWFGTEVRSRAAERLDGSWK